MVAFCMERKLIMSRWHSGTKYLRKDYDWNSKIHITIVDTLNLANDITKDELSTWIKILKSRSQRENKMEQFNQFVSQIKPVNQIFIQDDKEKYYWVKDKDQYITYFLGRIRFTSRNLASKYTYDELRHIGVKDSYIRTLKRIK